MKKKLIVLSGLVLGLAPVLTFAQGSGDDAFGILQTIGDLLNAVIPVVILLGVVYFVWGVVSYVIASDEEAKKSGKNRMIYGIIGLAVIVALWGLVNILVDTFSIDTTDETDFPGVVIPD
jgi:predicted membrane channel-forming protein YqfA (hemolysin III family)